MILAAYQQTIKSPKRSWLAYGAVAALAASVLLIIVVRIRTLNIPLERDEGEYAYAGQLLLDGVPPYKLAYNMKLPGIYAAYAGIMALFGQTTAGIHFGFLLINLATLALLFLVARRLLDSAHAVVACVCYALFSMCRGVLGLEGHATNLVVLAAMAGLLLLLKARQSGSLWTFAWSGVAFGLSFISKQPGLVFGFLGLLILLRDLAIAGTPLRMAFKRAAFFCTGLAAPFLLTCLLMAWAGTFDRFWFWTVIYARTHATLLTWKEGCYYLSFFYRYAGPLQWAWPVAALGLFFLVRDRQQSEARFIISSLLAVSLIAFTTSFYFTSHYFIMVLPALCLLIAVAFRRLARAVGEGFAAGLLALACAAFIFASRALWFEFSPLIACRSIYGDNPFPEAVEIGNYIRQNSRPDDTIAVLGSEPEIYFYAHRHSATGYIYMYDLMQPHQYALRMQEETARQIEAAKPAYMVFVSVDYSWLVTSASQFPIVDWSKTYSAANYDSICVAWLLSNRTDFVWGEEISRHAYTNCEHVTILKRKPGV
jgi:hypothetical protein